MLDKLLIPIFEKALTPMGPGLVRAGLSAERLMVFGFFAGLGAALLNGAGLVWAALGLFLVNRLLDGLAEASAQAGGLTSFGRYLDIALNFMVFGTIALSFGFSGDSDGLISAILVFSLLVWGGASLAYVGAGRDISKGKDMTGDFLIDAGAGLIGTTEITLGFILMFVASGFFAAIAIILSLLLFMACVFRVLKARRVLAE